MSVLQSLIAKCAVPVCEEGTVAEYDGIKLCGSSSSSSKGDVEFVQFTKEALALIARADPRRYHRVKAHVRYIRNKESCFSGHYLPGGICLIDFGRFSSDSNREWYLYMYAAAIVHEATHGHLLARVGHPLKPNRRTFVRIERICTAEENRFLRQIDSPWGTQLRIPFDPKAWDVGSVFARVRIMRRRVNEEKAKARQSPGTNPDERAG